MAQPTKIGLYQFGACRYNMHDSCDIYRKETGARCTCICHQKNKLSPTAPDRTNHGVPLMKQLSLFRSVHFRSGGKCLRCGEHATDFKKHTMKCVELGESG